MNCCPYSRDDYLIRVREPELNNRRISDILKIKIRLL